jgi:pimeloyl-ACP methyl ester carboxylesterase
MGTLNMAKIFILHGWTYNFDKWTDFVAELKNCGFEPVLLKIPGLTAKSDEIWDLDKYSGWLEKELSEEKGKVILLGHSNGGRIAAYFAAKHFDRVQKLILIDSAGIYHKELFLQIKRFIFGTVTRIGKRFTSSERLKNLLYYLVGERDYQKASSNMKLSMVNLAHHDLTPFLSQIRVSTLIIWGKEDKITPLSDAFLMNKLIKNSRLEVIDGARHSPFYTHARKVVRIIKNDI